jgi:hypothetical protein
MNNFGIGGALPLAVGVASIGLGIASVGLVANAVNRTVDTITAQGQRLKKKQRMRE